MMKLKYLITCFALAGTVVLGSFAEIASAQRSTGSSRIGLLSHTCVQEGGQSNNQEISINKQLFTALWVFAQPTATLTCRLDKRKRFPKETLRLQYGMNDNNSNPQSRSVTVFLDGVAVDEDEVRPGFMKTKLFDVSKTRSIAIESVCKNGGGCTNLYFFAAEIIPNAVSEIPTSETLNVGRTNAPPNQGLQAVQHSTPGNPTLGKVSDTVEQVSQVKKQVDQVNQVIRSILKHN